MSISCRRRLHTLNGNEVAVWICPLHWSFYSSFVRPLGCSSQLFVLVVVSDKKNNKILTKLTEIFFTANEMAANETIVIEKLAVKFKDFMDSAFVPKTFNGSWISDDQ